MPVIHVYISEEEYRRLIEIVRDQKISSFIQKIVREYLNTCGKP